VKGRCAGCGEVGPVARVNAHIRSCRQWAERYRGDPAGTLEPASEYERWQAEDQAAERAAEIAGSIAEVDAYRAGQAERFRRPPGILEE
jgi:hypothetical protein